MPPRGGRLSRLPRWVFWLVGAAISGIGAFAARTVAETMPAIERWWVWLAGSAAIFLGLWIVSLGSHARQDADNDENRPA